MHRITAASLLVGLAASRAFADPCPRALEIRFAPAANLQIAVWIEDEAGRFVDTIFVTRSTGALGLGNRPGNPMLKSDYRWPYGARAMVLPVWAHARGKQYPKVVMGGAPGPDDNDTIGYHFPISSPEPFYCSPSGGLHRIIDGVDTISCASPFLGAKGLYAEGQTSPYPPRADLVDFNEHDAPDVKRFAEANDVAIVSGATPPGGRILSPALRFIAPPTLPDGRYRIRVEASREADLNEHHHYPSLPDSHPDLLAFGHDAVGQPSIVWEVPITIDSTPRTALAADYAGYADWDGQTGALHPPDGTITTDKDDSGARRLILQSDPGGNWRVKVATLGCAAACDAPAAPTGLSLTPHDTHIDLAFEAPSGPIRPAHYDVHYRVGGPLTDATFMLGTAADSDGAPATAGPSGREALSVSGLKPQNDIWIGVRAVAACGAASPAAVAMTHTLAPEYTVLHGCFVATAAYGSPLANQLGPLRAVRDRYLLADPLGRVFVAAYYAFGPSFAGVIARRESLRRFVRSALDPVVDLIAQAPRGSAYHRAMRRTLLPFALLFGLTGTGCPRPPAPPPRGRPPPPPAPRSARSRRPPDRA